MPGMWHTEVLDTQGPGTGVYLNPGLFLELIVSFVFVCFVLARFD